MGREQPIHGSRIHLPEMDAARVADQIGTFILDQIVQTQSTGGVIGLSGGVDSTTAAALANRAIQQAKTQGVADYELVGYILPTNINNPADAEDGLDVARRLGIRHEVVNLEPLVQTYRQTNPEAFENNYDRGNMISRIRATVLNTKAATERKLVVGTGNQDEDFGIGYYTLFGDGAVHMSPLGGLSKRLVKQMARHLGFPDLADRIPTAGLEPGQTDFGDLGYSYEFVEAVTEGVRQRLADIEIKHDPYIQHVAMADIAAYERAFGKAKLGTTDMLVDDVLRRHRTVATPKGQLINPPRPDISLDYGWAK